MDRDFYHTLAAVQAKHWWYAARRTIIKKILDEEFRRGVPEGVIYDLGCGVGCNLGVLSSFRRTIGIDPSTDAVAICKELGFTDVILGSAEEVKNIAAPAPGVVVLTDVLEHVQDDARCIREISDILPANGLLVVTVPAFQFLWGPSDVTSHHYRRYRKPHLESLCRDYFTIELSTYFNTILFAPIAVGRFAERLFQRPGDEGAEIRSQLLNTFLRKTMESELPLIQRAAFPFGVSILVVLRKKNNL